jgi:hypothetical protein
MIRPNPFLEIDIAEHAAAVGVVAAHRRPQFPVTKESAMRPIGNPFSAAC